MKILILITVMMTCCLAKAQVTIYSFQLDSISGNKTIDFKRFNGKRILIVNTSSQDSSMNQWNELKQLHQFYRGSLVIVAIPSNSFGSEPAANTAIEAVYAQTARNGFPVAGKISVSGQGVHPLYQWLTQKSSNGVIDCDVRRPFQKYLINRNGRIVGVFSSKVRPMSPLLIQAIQNN